MSKSIVSSENESLTYEELCDKCSMLRDEFSLNSSLFDGEDSDFGEFNKTRSCSIDEKKESLKECISSMLKELWQSVNLKFGNRDIHVLCNDHIENWNEVIASVRINNELLELKLTNEYMPDYDMDINHIYITVFVNGKGIFTEWIENFHEEYEFAGSSSVIKSENELYVKNVEKEKFIDKVIKEIDKLL